jgi:hypothetical protein
MTTQVSFSEWVEALIVKKVSSRRICKRARKAGFDPEQVSRTVRSLRLSRMALRGFYDPPRFLEHAPDGRRMFEIAPGHVTAEENLKCFGLYAPKGE